MEEKLGIIKGEIVKEDNKEKTVYHYVNTEREIDILTRTVLKKEDKTIFHQLRREWKTKNIIPKYETIRIVILEGLNSKLPLGFSQKPSIGYGVTKTLRPFMKFLDKNSNVEEIILSRTKNTILIKKQLVINLRDLEFIRKNISSLISVVNEKNKVFVQNYLAGKFPKYFNITSENYQKGTLYRLLSEYKSIDKEISLDDKKALIDLFDKLSLSKKKVFEKRDLILRKEKIEEKFIEDILEEFEKLITRKRIKEGKWQNFFKENAWIFSQLFAYPAVLFKDQAYVGGKTIYDKDGKYVDYLYANDLTKNCALIEIKTHITRLLNNKPYRGRNVFNMDKELSGAIAQILDQKSVYGREFDSLSRGSGLNYFNPKCILIIGKLSDLNKEQQECFELIRSSMKDLDIITFDELLMKIKSILSLFKSRSEYDSKKQIQKIETMVRKSIKKKNETTNKIQTN